MDFFTRLSSGFTGDPTTEGIQAIICLGVAVMGVTAWIIWYKSDQS